MAARTRLIPLILALVALTTAADEPSFHGVHEGKEASSKLDYPALYANATPLSQSGKGRALLEGCFQAYGGREHLAALGAVCMVHEMTSQMFGNGTVKRSFAPERRYRIERSGQTRSLLGEKAWIQSEGEVAELGEHRYLGELFSYLTMRLPAVLDEEEFEEPRYAIREGDDLGYLFYRHSDSLMLVIGIDPETHFIRSSEGIVITGEDYVAYINRFDGHERFDGYVFPTRLVNVSMGLEVAQSKLVSVDLECDLTRSDFDPTQASRGSQGR